MTTDFQLLVEFIENPFSSSRASVCLPSSFASYWDGGVFSIIPIQCRQFACLPPFIILACVQRWSLSGHCFLNILIGLSLSLNSGSIDIEKNDRDSGRSLVYRSYEINAIIKVCDCFHFYINTKGIQKMLKFKKTVNETSANELKVESKKRKKSAHSRCFRLTTRHSKKKKQNLTCI